MNKIAARIYILHDAMQKHVIVYGGFHGKTTYNTLNRSMVYFTSGEVGMYMSTSSNMGRSHSFKLCSFARCKRQMKYRCGEISVATASGLLLGRSCNT